VVVLNIAWYVARTCGLVSWALLAFAVVWGLVLSTKAFRSRPRPAWTLDLHRFLGALAVLFTLVHIGALVADTYVHFGPAEIFVPLASRWHPVAVAWGVIALYLLVAVEGTSLLMRKMSNRSWKRVHRTSYILFIMATFHAITAGTDTRGIALRWASLVISGAISFLWLSRVASAKSARRAPAGHRRSSESPRPLRAPADAAMRTSTR
jgi:DMSO/TMAO reductase YedYZ heme-binding membrane subunit